MLRATEKGAGQAPFFLVVDYFCFLFRMVLIINVRPVIIAIMLDNISKESCNNI